MKTTKPQDLLERTFNFARDILLQQGEIDADLAAGEPSVVDWRLSTVPKYLELEEVQRLLSACNRQIMSANDQGPALRLIQSSQGKPSEFTKVFRISGRITKTPINTSRYLQ